MLHAIAVGPADPEIALQRWQAAIESDGEQYRQIMAAIERDVVLQGGDGCWYLEGHERGLQTSATSPDDIVTAYLFEPGDMTETEVRPQRVSVDYVLKNYALADATALHRRVAGYERAIAEVQAGNLALLGAWQVYRWCANRAVVDLVLLDTEPMRAYGKPVLVLDAEMAP
jgi:hypothetical protein